MPLLLTQKNNGSKMDIKAQNKYNHYLILRLFVIYFVLIEVLNNRA